MVSAAQHIILLHGIPGSAITKNHEKNVIGRTGKS